MCVGGGAGMDGGLSDTSSNGHRPSPVSLLDFPRIPGQHRRRREGGGATGTCSDPTRNSSHGKKDKSGGGGRRGFLCACIALVAACAWEMGISRSAFLV